MYLFFNLEKEFPNTRVIYINTTVKVNQIDGFENFIIFRDENFNIHSINQLNLPNSNTEKKFGFLNSQETNQINEQIIKLNSRYKVSNINYFRIGKIISRNIHPKSDKLFVLNVDFGDTTKQIITNTNYTLINKCFVFALPGSITSQGTEIIENQVMGVLSQGMLATGISLGLKDKDVFKGKMFEGENETYINNQIGKNVWSIFPEIIAK
ncbi:TyrS-associated PheT N-terminal domain-related protein TapR [Mycoplasmopsis lipofaciens]|uniref:TyrS-associated PheT N-terminal domain-related protein TapR n=1 Tax=Mycoplasmopsis lipofaciens TaxID=114884 RepID=UPI000689B9FE|nr:hypothetical protein [Mycoplasmopsis lipofaciens]